MESTELIWNIFVVVFQLVRLTPVVLLHDQVRLACLAQSIDSKAGKSKHSPTLFFSKQLPQSAGTINSPFKDYFKTHKEIVTWENSIFPRNILSAMLRTYSLQRGVAAAPLLLLLSLVTSVTSQNIDTATPILRVPSTNLADNAYFGYSLVLHQTDANPSNMEEAINGAR